MSTYFLLDLFEFPHYFYRIRGESIYVFSIIVCILSTFCPTLGHHHERIYCKSDVTFVLAYYYYVSYITFVIDPPLMMAQSRAESTRDTYNYEQYINQFPPNTIKVIWEFERIQKKIYRHKMSIMFNEICINEEMLPIYIYIYIYIYILSRKIRVRFFYWSTGRKGWRLVWLCRLYYFNIALHSISSTFYI